MANTTSLRYKLIPVIVLMAVCLAVFFNSFTNAFVWDDPVSITNNRYIQDIRNIPLFFTPRYWNELHPLPGQYRPLRAVSLALDYLFWQENPIGYRIVNLSLHTVNVTLVFYLVSLIMGKATAGNGSLITGRRFFLTLPLLTALFFATHPVHTETINLVKNRSELFAFLFFLLSFLLFIRHIRGSGRLSVFVAWFCFIPALLSKETALTLPGVLALYAVCFLSGADRRKALIRIVPYVGIIVIYFWFIHSFIRTWASSPAVFPIPEGAGQLTLTVIKTMGYYIRMLAVPYPLNLEYAFKLPGSLLAPSVLFPLALLLLIGGVLVWSFPRDRVVFFAIGWISLTLVPASNLIYVVARPIAEDRLYIPSFGFCLLLGYGIERLSYIRTKRTSPTRAVMLSGLLTIVIFCLYAGITVIRNFDWRDEVTLYSRTVIVNPDSPRIQYNLGNALAKAGNREEAICHYQAAIRLRPDYIEALYNLGNTYYELGRYGDAIRHYRTILRLAPENIDALNNCGAAYYAMGRLADALRCFQAVLKVSPDDIKANKNMGDVLVDTGRLNEAVDYYLAVLRVEPASLSVYNSLGNVFLTMGEADKAIWLYSDALAFYPDDVSLHYGLGNALADRGRFDETISHFSTVLRLQPDYPEINYKIGNIFLRMGDTERAVAFYRKAVGKEPHHAGAYNNLGVCLMKQGEIDNAVVCFRKVLGFEPDNTDANYNLGIALMARQDYHEAAALFSRVLDIDPDHPRAKREYDLCLQMMGKGAGRPEDESRP